MTAGAIAPDPPRLASPNAQQLQTKIAMKEAYQQPRPPLSLRDEPQRAAWDGIQVLPSWNIAANLS